MIMPILEDLKEYTGRATGLKRPGKREASNLTRGRKPHAVRFKDDGFVPNHQRWPLIIYRGAVDLDERHDPAAVIEDLFEANGWGDTWRAGIYHHAHYHSRIHEVLGIARSKGRVRFGGNKGPIFTLKAGDAAILPAGTGHQCLSADDDFPVVGAYPPTGTYDECTTVEDHPRALRTIPEGAAAAEGTGSRNQRPPAETLEESEMTEYLIRFLVGGVVVSAFAMLGDVLRPKSFAGLFGAAPSIALATLGIAVYRHGPDYAAFQSQAMMAGAIALAIYSIVVCHLLVQTRLRAAPATLLSLVVWLIVAFGLLTLAAGQA
jgi:uncharacterized protein YjlB/uncharacterized membrane protein (GlpM family)